MTNRLSIVVISSLPQRFVHPLWIFGEYFYYTNHCEKINDIEQKKTPVRNPKSGHRKGVLWGIVANNHK